MFQYMSFGDSLLVSVLGMGIVFVTLIALIFAVKGLSAIVGAAVKKSGGDKTP